MVVRHPLQPFHPDNFVPGALGRQRAFSFDRTELAGARATSGPKAAPPAFLPAPLAAVRSDGDVVTLDELTGFLEHPVKGFLRQRVGLPVAALVEPAADALPVQLDGLAGWAIGDRLLRDRLAGHPLDRCRQAEWRRGELPPGALGDAQLTRILDDVEPLVAVAAPMRTEALPDHDVDVPLPDGRRLIGTLDELYCGQGGPTLLRVEYSRLAPKQRIRAWVRLLALVATAGGPWLAVTVGRGAYHGLARATLGPLDRRASAGHPRRAGGAARCRVARSAATAHGHRSQLRPGPARRRGRGRGGGGGHEEVGRRWRGRRTP